MRGRLPKPTQLKIVQGTARPDRMNEDEPVPPAGDIVPPAWLKKRARRLWAEMSPILMQMGVLTTADVQAFAVLCETQAEFIEARADVAKRGTEIERTRYGKDGMPFVETRDNPSVRIASDAGKRVKAMMVEFGMSPSSRSRVKATPAPKEKSALEKLRDRGRQA